MAETLNASARKENEEPALAVLGVGKSFDGVKAVVDASFSVPPATITGLIGPNGAGKSTTLSIIGGELTPSTGSVHFLGHDVTGATPFRLAREGIIRTFQLSSEFARLTAMENLLTAGSVGRHESLWAALMGKRHWGQAQEEDTERARILLKKFDIRNEDEYAGNLSGGQKRLLEIARALMARPKMLLLDEPMAGVNPALASRVEEHLLELRSEGLTMLMVSHELGSVERLCDVVVAMANGRVIAHGSMADIRRDQEVLDAYLIG